MAKILLVEDDDDVCYGFSRTATERGHDVITSRDHHFGLMLFQEERPEIVVCDMVFSGNIEGGLEFLRAARRMDMYTPIVIATGYHDNTLERKSLEAGATHFVPKPLYIEQVETVLREHRIAFNEYSAQNTKHEAPPKLRISMLENDIGFMAVIDAKSISVTIDGVQVKDCVTADETEGEVIVMKRDILGNLLAHDNKYRFESITGLVQIHGLTNAQRKAHAHYCSKRKLVSADEFYGTAKNA